MTRTLLMGWLLPMAGLLASQSAWANPQSCLSYRENSAVAACANQFLPGGVAKEIRRSSSLPAPAPTPAPSRSPANGVQIYADGVRFPAPLRASPAAVRTDTSAPRTLELEHAALFDKAVVAMMIAAGLVLVVGFWRWRASLVKSCKYCAARLNPGASVCRKCFRAV